MRDAKTKSPRGFVDGAEIEKERKEDGGNQTLETAGGA
jgi:hypothetical protein